jgi:hypothetical protein
MKYFQNAGVGVGAAALVADQPCGQLLLVSAITNTVTVFVGDSTSQPFPLAPGQSISMRVAANANEIYVRSASGTATVNWMVDAISISSSGVTVTASTDPVIVLLQSGLSSGSIAASATYDFPQIDLSLYTAVTVFVTVAASHSWSSQLAESLTIGDTLRSLQTLVATASQGSSASVRISLRLPVGRIRVTNNDVGAQTYTLYAYGIRR